MLIAIRTRNMFRMREANIIYKNPFIYTLALQLLHGRNFSKRYQYMASFVKPGDVVLEPACGPAILPHYLPKNTSYVGFDANASFVKHASQKYDAYMGNVLDVKSYKKADVVVTCDILHHLAPKDRRRFIKNCFDFTRKTFVLCEPVVDGNQAKDIFSPLRDWFVEWSERDGTNHITTSYFPKKDAHLLDIKQGFGVIPKSAKRTIEQIGEDIIVSFSKT